MKSQTQVIKSDGRRQAFDAEKIRRAVESAARDAELPEKKVRSVVEDVTKKATKEAEKKKEIRSEEIREIVLKELDKKERSVADAWREYEDEEKAQD